MNEIFDFSRFWKYFKYDLVSNLREHKVKIGTFLLAPVAFYIIYTVLSLIFSHEWINGTPYRITVGVLMNITFLIYYPVLCYGFLTDKKPGSSWLMIPVSTTEKYVSMILNSLVIIPVCFLVSYFVLDAILCILPDAGKPLIGMITAGTTSLVSITTSDDPVSISGFSAAVLTIIQCQTVIAVFLLGAVCFKKNKVAKTILSIMLVSFLFLTIVGFLAWALALGDTILDPLKAFVNTIENHTGLAVFLINSIVLLCVVVPFAAILTGIYFRVKTIKH